MVYDFEHFFYSTQNTLSYLGTHMLYSYSLDILSGKPTK